MDWKFCCVILSFFSCGLSSCALGPLGHVTKVAPSWISAKQKAHIEKSETYDWDIQENLSEPDAQKFISDRVRALTNLVEPEADPYTGTTSLPETCHRKNLPPISKQNDPATMAVVFSIYASRIAKAQPIIGNCNTSPLLKTQYLFLYCRDSRRLLTVRYFYPDSMPWLTEPIASCPL